MSPTHRRRRLLTAALTITTTLAATASVLIPGAQASGPATVSVRLGAHPADLTFNDPRHATGGRDRAQMRKAIELIDGAPKGSSIRMGIFSISRPGVLRAIKRAKRRGVDVFVVHSGDKQHMSDAKYMLFSRTKGVAGRLRSNVVWFSSGNFTDHSGAEMSNNTVTIYDDAVLYNGFLEHVWNPMWEERSYGDNDYYVASGPRGYFGSTASNSQVYVSPEQTTDLVVNRLDFVRPDGHCRIRVMQASINDSRGAVVDKLVALKRGGCRIWIAASTIEARSREKLRNSSIPVHYGKIHDKAFIISARYDSSSPRTVILTGSHNVTASALTRNDELLVKLTDNRTMYRAFVRHFNNAYRR